MRQNYFVGEFSINTLFSILQELLPQKILLVRGRDSFETSGGAEVIKSACSNISCEIVDFYDFSVDPKIEDLNKGLCLLDLNNNIDLIIGIGGGSVLDMSKLIRFFYSFQGDISSSKFEKTRDLLPLITIPTTAGTGSEVTHFAVLYKNNVKYSIANKNMLSDIAIVDPVFTYNAPKYLTACTGFDALAQAIEAYWNVYATNESDEYAIKSIQLIWPNLTALINSSTKDLRAKISEGAFWAGKAINITKTTAPHAFSYPFTAYYGYPHGHAVALTFPYFILYNYPKSSIDLNPKLDFVQFRKKMNRLYLLLGISEIENASNVMKDYLNAIYLRPNEPKNYNPELILENINLQRANNNPVELDENKMRELVYKKIFA